MHGEVNSQLALGHPQDAAQVFVEVEPVGRLLKLRHRHLVGIGPPIGHIVVHKPELSSLSISTMLPKKMQPTGCALGRQHSTNYPSVSPARCAPEYAGPAYLRDSRVSPPAVDSRRRASRGPSSASSPGRPKIVLRWSCPIYSPRLLWDSPLLPPRR